MAREDSFYVPVGRWMPDLPRLSHGASAVRVLNNMIHHSGGLCAAPSLTAEGTDLTPAHDGHLNDPVRWIGEYQGRTGASTILAVRGTGRTGVSQVGIIGGDGFAVVAPIGIKDPLGYQTARYGDKLVFAGISGSGVFEVDASGASATVEEWSSSDGDPVGRAVGVIGDSLVVGGLNGNESQARFSAIGNHREFNIDNDQSAAIHTFPEGNGVQAITGGDSGLVFCRNAVYRVIPTSTRLKYVITNISPEIGLLAPRAWVRYGRNVYFLSSSGFKMINQDQGVEISSIGYGQVDNWFFDQLAGERVGDVDAYLDEKRKQVVWVYPSEDAAAGEFNRAICYNYEEGRWGQFVIEKQVLDEATGERIGGESAGAVAVGVLSSLSIFTDDANLGAVKTDNDGRDTDDPAFGGTGGFEVNFVDSVGVVRAFDENDLPAWEFGLMLSVSEISALVRGEPPEGAAPDLPAYQQPMIKAGRLAEIEYVRIVAPLDYRGLGLSLLLDFQEFHDPRDDYRWNQGLADNDFIEFPVRESGAAAVCVRAQRVGFGFTARGQRANCQIPSFAVVAKDGGLPGGF